MGRLITEPNMSAVVKGLFRSRAASFFRLTLPVLGYYQAFVKPLINMIYSTIFSRGFQTHHFLHIPIGNQLLKLKFARGSHVNGINSALTTQACMLPRSA